MKVSEVAGAFNATEVFTYAERVVSPAARPAPSHKWTTFFCPVCPYTVSVIDPNATVWCNHPRGPFGQRPALMTKKEVA